MKFQPCDNHQETISALTDDGLPFPQALHDHISSCPECAAFARICREDGGILSAPLPPAGDDLRRKILRLPQANRSRPRFPVTALSAAAAILIAAVWWSTRAVPEAPPAPPFARNETEKAAEEIAALKDDFDQALGHLAEPLAVFSSLARP